MIRIDNERCCGCGHCQSIRMTLPLVKSVDLVDYHEDPRPEDRDFVEKIMLECWSQAIQFV